MQRQREFTLAAATILAGLVVCWSYRRRRQARIEKQTASIPNKFSVPTEDWRSFEQAVASIRSVHTLTNGDKLMLYGLYKQATVGDAPDKLPQSGSWNIIAEQAKFTSWKQFRGMPPMQAVSHYVTAVQEFTSLVVTNTSEDDSDTDSYAANNESMAPTVSRPVEPFETQITADSSLELQFLQAASQNDLDTLRKLLPLVDVNFSDPEGQTALHLAADRGCNDGVQLLLDHQANVNGVDNDGISVLQAAVIAGHVHTIQLLLKHGADPDQPDVDGDTPRSCASDDPQLATLFSFDVPLTQ